MSPFSDHPIYRLRATLLVSDGLGILSSLICVFADSYYYYGKQFSVAALILLLSGLLVVYDLVSYKMRKDADPDNSPPWPLRKFMYADLGFALILQWTAWILWAESTWGYQSSGFFQAYGALAVFVSSYGFPTADNFIPADIHSTSIVHGICFWKEVLGRQKAAWLAKVPLLPCSVCGATNQGGRAPENPSEAERDRAAELRARVYDLTPDDTSESHILIQTDFDSSYGAIGQECPAPSSTARLNKLKKGKGKGKASVVDAL